jgi:hypothetical protein
MTKVKPVEQDDEYFCVSGFCEYYGKNLVYLDKGSYYCENCWKDISKYLQSVTGILSFNKWRGY